MKTIIKSLIAVFLLAGMTTVYAQQPELGYFRPNDQDGVNVFETPKDSDVPFDGVKVRLGGDFALQFQSLSQTNSGDSLAELGSNFNLPTANLNIDVQLADGVRLHMRTYLSSKHHTEAYVKGGYLQIDKLDFIREGFMSGFMDMATIKFGMDEINYGDTQFRRSDNARAIYNPFVGNYIMDVFTTEPYAELTIQNNGLLGVLGLTNGRLNQNVVENADKGFVIYGKLGYDKQINDDLRLRLTGSFYNSSKDGSRDYIYGGDRAGSRYYGVIDGGDFSGRYNPRFPYHTAIQINPFIKFQGLEFFGVYEMTNNGEETESGAEVGGSFTQIGAEAIYRFGGREQLYLGGRYNAVSGEQTETAATREINRLNLGGGWYLTKNILTKVEYVSQTYKGDGFSSSDFQGAEFNGLVIEAVIGF
tara:strand:- start:12783 stop:14036 length:1254 start_codon:yes stop_codon:yes gene_type:complete